MSNHRFNSRGTLSWGWVCLIALLPIVFAIGRFTGPAFETLREAEATPVPHALPLGVTRFHDASEEVTCWRLTGSGGIACLPDQWLASARIEADAP